MRITDRESVKAEKRAFLMQSGQATFSHSSVVTMRVFIMGCCTAVSQDLAQPAWCLCFTLSNRHFRGAGDVIVKFP